MPVYNTLLGEKKKVVQTFMFNSNTLMIKFPIGFLIILNLVTLTSLIIYPLSIGLGNIPPKDKNVTVVDTSEGNSTTVCQECIFPFKFDNETFYNCTDYGYTNIWCSVKVDKEAVHQEGFWQDCGICDCSCIQLSTSSVNGTFITTSMNDEETTPFERSAYHAKFGN